MDSKPLRRAVKNKDIPASHRAKIPVPKMWMCTGRNKATRRNRHQSLGLFFICPFWEFSQQVLCHFLSTWQYHIHFCGCITNVTFGCDHSQYQVFVIAIFNVMFSLELTHSLTHKLHRLVSYRFYSVFNHNLHGKLNSIVDSGAVQNILTQRGP